MKIMKYTFLLLTLSGCATTYENVPMNVIPTPGQLVGFKLDQAMAPDDKAYLYQLVTTSKPKQSISWKSRKTKDEYDFISHAIYINGKGEPCRSYDVLASIGWDKMKSQQVACRDDRGRWGIDMNEHVE